MNCKLVLSLRSQFFHSLRFFSTALDDPALGHDLEGVQFAALGNLHRELLA